MKEKLVLNILLITIISIFTGCAGGIANYTGTPLEKKFAKKDLDNTIKYLSTKNVKTLRYGNGKNILQLALNQKFVKLANHIIDNDLVDVKYIDSFGLNALSEATSYPQITQKLIDKGVRAGLKSKNGFTALHQASVCCENNTKVIKLLLDNGANINAITDNKISAVHYAVLNNKYKNIEFLIKNGAKLEKEMMIGTSMMRKNTELVNLLVKNNANVKYIDPYGNNVLHYLALHNSSEYIEKATINGVNINALNKRNLTPLSNLIYAHLNNQNINPLFKDNKKGFLNNTFSAQAIRNPYLGTFTEKELNTIYALVKNGAAIYVHIIWGNRVLYIVKNDFIKIATEYKHEKLLKLLSNK